MKKNKDTPVYVKFSAEKKSFLVSHYLYNFLTFFTLGLGFYSSLLLMTTPSSAPAYQIILFLVLCALFLTALQKIKLLPAALAFSTLPVAFIIYLYREALILQSNSFLYVVNKLLKNAYNLSPFSSLKSTSKNPDLNLLFFITTYIYLLIFFIVLKYKKSILFFTLLSIPIILNFACGVSPSYFSIGCIISACLLWYFIKPVFFILALVLYIVCAVFLTPKIAPELFKFNKPVYQTVNTWTDNFGKYFANQTKVTSEPPSKPFFSFEPEESSSLQTLSNAAPVYSHRTMFELTCNKKPDSPLYLKGFVGQSYTEAAWNAPEAAHWNNFCKRNQLSNTEINTLFSIPYVIGKEYEPDKIFSISLTPKFNPEFAYFPYGAQLSDNIFSNDTSAVKSPTVIPDNISCYPLSLSSAYPLFSATDDVPEKYIAFEQIYKNYAMQEYMNNSFGIDSRLHTELSTLPVYSSIPSNHDFDDIQAAAEEIQEFLKSQASYSLSLDPVPSNSSFLEEFLYNQKKGFCVHFATAGTLLFRMYGIPARYVSGYVAYPKDFKEESSSRFTCNIKDSSAHAWTEIYIGNGGWVPIEVTPPAYNAENEFSPTEPTTTPATPENIPPASEEKTITVESSPAKNTAVTNGNTLSETKIEVGPYILLSLKFLLTMCIMIFLLSLRYNILYRKHIGFFAKNRSRQYLTIHRNLLKLWQTEFKIPEKDLETYDWKKVFLQKLPTTMHSDFETLCNEADRIYFGSEKITKQQLRTLRFTYHKVRKRILRNLPLFKRWYYKYVKVL